MKHTHERLLERLVVLGGGHVGRTLSALAAVSQVPHAVVDDRADHATPERFPDARPVLCAPFPGALRTLDPDARTAVVIATRCHRTDLVCLEAAMDTNCGYIGLIGSRTKVNRILDQLAVRGIRARADGRLHAPVGLDLGGDGPGAIALAIMAELVCWPHGPRWPAAEATAKRAPGRAMKAAG